MILELGSLLLVIAIASAKPLTVTNATGLDLTRDVLADPDLRYRIQETVVPSNYKLELTLKSDFFETKSFSGVAEIKFKVTEEIADFRIHTEQIVFTDPGTIVLTEDGGNAVVLSAVDVQPKYQTRWIKCASKLKPEASYTLKIIYDATLFEDMYGFYLSSYVGEDNEAHHVATTQFQPTHARRAFPCFDEPRYKATFDIIINHPSEYKALANTKQTVESNATRSVFTTSPKMSTYLVAFVVSDFVKISDEEHKFNIWARENAIDTAKYSLSVSPGMLQALEKFTGIPYWPNNEQLDQVAISDFGAGAMENWGLVTYRETALLWDETESTKRNKQRVATVIAHEFAHMWFGNLVTLDWWSSTWLNEGFARYFEYHTTKEVETSWELEKQFVIEQQQSIFVTDAVSSALPLTSMVYTPSEVSNKFSSLSYNKGACVIKMMEHFMEHENFKLGLQNYLNEYKFTNTVPAQLFEELSKVENNVPESTTFEAVMKGWTEQSGYPMVTAKLSADNKVNLSQTRFLYDDAVHELIWSIPISYTSSVEKDFEDTSAKVWLLTKDQDSEIVLADNNWIILNIKQTGYYRVNYDAALWRRIQEGLNKIDFDGIDELNRAQIVDDALNLARGNELDYGIALNITSYLANETSYYAWYSAFNGFSYLRRRLSDGDIKTSLDKYIIDLMDELYKHTSFKTNSVDTQIDTFKNTLTLQWACELNHKDCYTKALEQFRSYKEENIMIDQDLRSVVYCGALRHAENDENWEFLRQKLNESNSASEQATITTALGCTRNKALLKKYLMESISPVSGIRKQDAYSVFTSVVTGNSEGVAVAFTFLKENHANISETYASMNALSSVITTIADRLTTTEEIAEFEKFIEEAGTELKDAQVIAQTAIKTAKANLEWVNKYSDDLANWLGIEIITTTTTTTTTVAPPVTTPSTAAPPVTTPSTAVPPVTTPSTAVPPVTTPSTAVPPVTIPSTIVPPVTTPTSGSTDKQVDTTTAGANANRSGIFITALLSVIVMSMYK